MANEALVAKLQEVITALSGSDGGPVGPPSGFDIRDVDAMGRVRFGRVLDSELAVKDNWCLTHLAIKAALAGEIPPLSPEAVRLIQMNVGCTPKGVLQPAAFYFQAERVDGEAVNVSGQAHPVKNIEVAPGIVREALDMGNAIPDTYSSRCADVYELLDALRGIATGH